MLKKDKELKETESVADKSADEVSETAVKVKIEKSEAHNEEEPIAPPGPTEEEKLRARVVELEDKLLRTAAEFDNFKKRAARQYDDVVRSANDRLIVQLLDVVDNFERALVHGDNSDNNESLRTGIELILNQFKDMLTKYDVTPIEAVGQPFDPSLHEAFMRVESDEFAPGVVAMQVARGYRVGNRVLRYAKVGVSSGQAEKKMDNPPTDIQSDDENSR